MQFFVVVVDKDHWLVIVCYKKKYNKINMSAYVWKQYFISTFKLL